MTCRCETHPAKRALRCPKCGNRELTLAEHIDCTGEFQQHADGSIDLEGYNQEGSYYKVTASCNECGHLWTVRKATQITSIRDDHACPVRDESARNAPAPDAKEQT